VRCTLQARATATTLCGLHTPYTHARLRPRQTPELLAELEVPESLSVLGQTVDLSQLRGLLQPVSQGLSGIISQARVLGGVESTRAEG
jgi:hypothetical protein